MSIRENKGYGNFILGIPCKCAEVIVIPKHIYKFFDEGEITKCRGGELVTLELLQEYTSMEAVSADLSAMYGISIEEYTSLWEKRVDALKLRKNGWVKVKMNKIATDD